jgi:hypothetical protein
MCEASTPAITPIILCGGSGTRLWPLSRKSYPKQFAQIMENESLLQSCVRRLSGTSEVLVADMARTQDVGQVVKEQRAKGVAQACQRRSKIRPENPGKVPMTLIKVQTGIYLGEDDITRYKDVYARGTDEV